MDTSLSILQLWWSLPTPLKLCTIIPQTIILPIQISTYAYKSYKWFYPSKQEQIVYTITQQDDDFIELDKYTF